MHHDSMLIKVQLDVTACRHLFSATSLYMFRVSCTHHQEYYKLYLLPLVYVMLMVHQSGSGHGGRK